MPLSQEVFKENKKKAMLATWSDSEDSSSKEKTLEEANLCLMAQEEKVIFESKCEFICDELHDAFMIFWMILRNLI